MTEFNRRDIAARLRGIIAGQDRNDLAETARRLHVDEVSLRMSIDESSPYPTLDVIASVVAYYAVDATYLITGQYDGATHRHTLSDPDSVLVVVNEIVHPGQSSARIASPTDEPPR